MPSKCHLAALAVVLSLAGTPARAMVCMEKSMTLDEVVDTISAQKGCESAMKVFRDCELTASGDVQLGAAVERKCEADFKPGLDKPALMPRRHSPTDARCAYATASTGTSPAPCISRSRHSVGRRSPSVTRNAR